MTDSTEKTIMRRSPTRYSALIAPLFTLLFLTPSISTGLAKQPDNTTATAPALEASVRHARTAEEILAKLQRRHYLQRPFDDTLSSALLDNYLEQLDPTKSYLTSADVTEFERYRFSLDDGIRRGNLSPSYALFNRYRESISRQLEALIEQLPKRIAALDFSRNESLSLAPEERDWAADHGILNERARKTLKNTVLGLKLAGKDESAIVEMLDKRYRNQLERIKQLNTEDVFQLYINSLTELYDPHTNYLSPKTSENFSINMRLSLEGIGAVLRSEGEHTVVQRLIAAGPAEKQGQLRPSDKIIAIGQGESGELVDVIGWRLDEVVELIRGKKGSTVRLEVLSEDVVSAEKSRQIEIVRNTVKLEEQSAQKRVLSLQHGERQHKLGVIRIPTFYIDFDAVKRGEENYKSTTRDVAQLIEELEAENIEGLIIDLRGNGGGSLQEAKQLTGLFVERGPVVQIRLPNGDINRQSNYPNPHYYKKPIAVLIDRLSASASEIFSGAVQDYQRGLIIGSQSFGKGTVQQLSALGHGTLKLTEAKFYRISGASTQHRGIIPDILFPSLYDHEEIGESTLDHALSWDTVPAVRHRNYGQLQPLIEPLTKLHQQRASDDPDFRYLEQQIALNARYSALESISLNEEKRRKKIDNNEREQLEIKNRQRLAKGLEPLGSLDSEANAEKSQADSKEDENDFLLDEAARILLDANRLQKSAPQSEKQLANAFHRQ